MNYLIRRPQIKDMIATQTAHQKSIYTLCSHDYTTEEIQAWGNVKYSEDIWQKTVNDDYALVVEINDKIEGICHGRIRDDGLGEIVGLYFTQKIAGKGIGRIIFGKVTNELASRGAKEFIIFATITARGFYEKMGFKVVKPIKTRVRGVTIDSFEMRMSLEL
jgi:putative acetyltransferase